MTLYSVIACNPIRSVAFCRTRARARELATTISRDGSSRSRVPAGTALTIYRLSKGGRMEFVERIEEGVRA